MLSVLREFQLEDQMAVCLAVESRYIFEDYFLWGTT